MRSRRTRICMAGLMALFLIPVWAPPASSRDISIWIVRPDSGSIIGAEQRIITTTTGEVVFVDFEWSPDGTTWLPIGVDLSGSDRWATTWSTNAYNGPAIVRVTAHGAAETARDRVRVRVVNRSPSLRVKTSPDPFSPNRDGRKDRTAIRVDPNKPVHMTIRVIDAKGRVRRKWRRESKDGRARKITWKGKTAAGPRVPDGQYRISVTARDSLGLKDRAATAIRLDTKKPRLTWRKIAPEPTSGRRRLRFRFATRDRSRRTRLRIHFFDDLGRLDASPRFSRARGRAGYSYRPRYRSGKAFVPATYFAEISGKDAAGNIGSSKARPWRVHRNVGARTWTRVDGAGRKVALTFDDCNDPGAWHRLLSILHRHRAEATFFCPGRQVLANPLLARRTVRAHHSVGSHGWDHAWLSGRSVTSIAYRLRKDRTAWWKAARASPVPYFRPPYGASDANVRAAAAQTSHHRIILWDVDPSDYTNPPPSYISSRVVRESRPGSIVVMHVGDNTASALPSIITGLRRKGLEPVSLHALFRAAGYR